MIQDDAAVIMRFRDIMVAILREMLAAFPVVIPQTEEHRQIYKDGAQGIQQLLYELTTAETVRDVGKVIDIQAVLADFDIDSIEDFQKSLSQTARLSMDKLMTTIESLYG